MMKKSKSTKKENFLKNVISEMKKVKWPEFKQVTKYFLATLVFCLLLVGYFQGLDFISSIIRGLFN